MNGNIKISISRNDLGIGATPQQETKGANASKGMSVSDVYAIGAIKSASKQVLNTAISQYGNLTGNYIAQQQMQDVMSIGGDLLTIATAGPVVGGIAVATKYSVQAFNSIVQTKTTNMQQELMRSRTMNVNGGGRLSNE